MSHLSDMIEKVNKLNNRAGIQNLLDEAYKILGNPIAMFDTEYSLIAYTNVVTDDPIWKELIANGTFCKETQRFFEKEGFIEEIANASKSALLQSKKLKYDRINGKIFNKNNSYVANLIIVACDKPFAEGDILIYEAICKLVSKEISRNEFFQEYEQTHQETIIKNLIDGTHDIKLDMAQVEILYDTLAPNLYLVVAEIPQYNTDCPDAKYFRNLFKKLKPAYKYAIYSKYVIIIASTNAETFDVNKAFKELITVFDQNDIHAGISSKFENLFELQKYYSEALKAMQYTLESKSGQRIFPCAENSIEKMEQIAKLKNGEGLQYFLNTGAEIFGNPLLFHDMELNLLAYTDNMEITDPIWEELIAYGTSSNETIALFDTEGFISTMENTKGGAILVSEKIKYDRISWKIYSNDNIMIGCVSMVNTVKPFNEDELLLFGAFSQRFSNEVGKIEFYNNYGRVYSETLINRLISGKIDDYAYYSEDIGNLYDNFMENLYVIVIDTSNCDSKNANLTYFRDLFNMPDTVNRYAIYANQIIIISSSGSTSLNTIKINKINNAFEKNNIYAGISSRFENMYELRKYYMQAVNALNDGIKNNQNSSQKIFLSDKPYS